MRTKRARRLEHEFHDAVLVWFIKRDMRRDAARAEYDARKRAEAKREELIEAAKA